MPVVVTDASDPVGGAVVSLLAGAGEVRAFARGPGAMSLRAIGAKVTERDLLDGDAIRSALNDAHTVIHNADGLFGPGSELERTNLESTRKLIRAGQRAGIRRFLLVSSTGADAASTNPYLATKGEAEAAVVGSGFEHAIFRVTLLEQRLQEVFPQWLLWRLVPGDGRQLFAPVDAGVVARVLVAADDRAGSVDGTYSLAGDARRAADLARSIAPRRPILRARPGTTSAARLGVSAEAAEVLAGSRLADRPDAYSLFDPGRGTPQTH